MVFFVNNSGVITNSFPEQVFEGSANANSFYVVAPFANNLTATVAFTLPNGIVTQPYGLTATGEISGFTDGSGNTYYGWSMELPNAVTTYYGKVIAQVAFYSANRLLCTSATTFTVGRGVAAELPETPTEDVYQQILQALAQLQSDLGNGYFVARAVYVWNAAYTYGAGELVYYPMGTYGVYVKSNVANNTQEPYTDGTINSNWSLALDFNGVMGVLSSAEEAAASAEAAANSASAAATSRAIAEQAATSASGSASAAATSESNAESAADRAEAAAQENEAALGNYYTKIEIDSGVAKTAEVTMDNTTYVVTITLKAADGTVLSTSSVDLPLESVVVSGSYNSDTKSIDLKLQNGSTVSIPVGDLVEGLASQTALDNVINGTTPVAKATNADNATTADTADKVQNALTLVVDGDTQTYDGSSPISIELNTQSNTDPEAVHYTAQTLTSEQQAQARSNIGAQASGNYALQDGTYPNLNTPKTLYNLGAYDTYTSNGDGTATITRKTGYAVNEDGTTTQSELDTALQYTEKVIENQPLNTLPQDGEQWVRSEWEKGLNLAPWDGTTNYSSSSPVWQYLFVAEGEPNQPYYLVVKNFQQDHTGYGGLFLCQNDNPNIPIEYAYLEGTDYLLRSWEYNPNSDLVINFVPTKKYVMLGFSTDNTPKTISLTSIMLNFGSHPYPYQPYNGEIVRSAGSYRDLQSGGLVPYLEANPQTDGISGTGYVCFFKQTNIAGWQSWGATILVTQGYDKQDTSIVSINGRTDNGVVLMDRYEVIAGNDISGNLTYYYDSDAQTVYFYLAAGGDAYCKFFKLGDAGNRDDLSVFPTSEKFQSSVSTTGQASYLRPKNYSYTIGDGTACMCTFVLPKQFSTVAEIAAWLNTNEFTQTGGIYPASGARYTSARGLGVIIGIWTPNGTEVNAEVMYGTDSGAVIMAQALSVYESYTFVVKEV